MNNKISIKIFLKNESFSNLLSKRYILSDTLEERGFGKVISEGVSYGYVEIILETSDTKKSNNDIQSIVKSLGVNGSVQIKTLKDTKRNIKPGNIYSFKLSNGRIAFLQFIFKDEEYLGGDLIRCYDYSTEENAKIDITSIISSYVKLYAYTFIDVGLRENVFSFIGHYPIEKNFEPSMFRSTPDAYADTKKSCRWEIFISGQDKRISIGELSDRYKHLPDGIIFPPKAIVKWYETGSHGFLIPG